MADGIKSPDEDKANEAVLFYRSCIVEGKITPDAKEQIGECFEVGKTVSSGKYACENTSIGEFKQDCFNP